MTLSAFEPLVTIGRRRDCFIASKVSPGHLRPDDLRRSLEASLRRLRTDWLDLCYIHWPNDEIPIAQTMAALEKAREEGLVGHRRHAG